MREISPATGLTVDEYMDRMGYLFRPLVEEINLDARNVREFARALRHQSSINLHSSRPLIEPRFSIR
jgi:hypothetical protein